MKDWKELLRGGFADVEAPFAIKPPDQRRAREMVYVCKVLEVSLKEILQEAEVYLASKSQNKALIQEQLDRVKRYYKSVKFENRKKRAWLIRWNHSHPACKGFDPLHIDPRHIISVFDSRRSRYYIADFILQHYLVHESMLEDKIYYSSRLKKYPYQVAYDGINGIMSCGHNPHITARIVKNLCLSYIDDDDEMIHWDDFKRTPPSL